VLDDSESLLKTLTALEVEPFVLIRALGTVCGVVTRADLQKPHARMWLFGIVTLIEMRFTELIERHGPEDGWKQYVSTGRLQKVESLRAERQRGNQLVRVLDCLQFADKGQIVARNEAIREQTIFTSRREAERTTKSLERLRNNLAHAQDFATSDWETIVSLCRFMARPDQG
jgi:hypothetical protein